MKHSMVTVALAFLYGCGCPVEIGDRVQDYTGRTGTVGTIEGTRGGTVNCKVGVRWDEGKPSKIEAWELTREQQDG